MGFRERPVKYREFEKLLKNLGFELKRQDGTSHRQWEHPRFKGERRLVTVSPHNEPFTRSLLKDMMRQMGMRKNEFFKCLENERHAKSVGAQHSPEVVQPAGR